MRILRLTILLSIFTLVLAACGSQLTAEEIMDRMQAARENLNSAHATADVSMTTPERNATVQIEAWAEKVEQADSSAKPNGKLRVHVLQASEPEMVGAEFVSDGETFWLYQPDENVVLTGDQSDLQHNELGAQDQTMQLLRMQEMLQQLIDGSDVVVESQNETVAERSTWKVQLQPTAETNQQLQLGSLITTYLWIDKQSDLPVKVRIEAGSQGTLEATATTLDLNQPVAADHFTFTIPDGARVVDASELLQRFQPESTTIEGAREQASFSVLAPATLPEGVQLEDVQILRTRGETVIQYYGGDVTFSIVQSAGDTPGRDQAPPPGAQTQQITVRGQNADLITASGDDGGTLLRWEEDGITYVIAGTLSAEQATALAESLE